MVADVEVTGGARGGGRRWVSSDNELDAEHGVGVGHDALREWEIEVDADDGEDEAEREPEVGEEGVEGCGALD